MVSAIHICLHQTPIVCLRWSYIKGNLEFSKVALLKVYIAFHAVAVNENN